MAENTPLPLYTPHDGDTLYTIPDQPSFAEPPPPPPPRPPAPFRRRARTQGQGALQLVTPTQLKGHLALLHAFHALKVSVQDGKDIRFPAAARKLDERRRWAWFVALAVERFERWCVTIEETDVEWRGLPPIDVAMVWHAYLLNPSWYAEDTMRIPVLGTLAKYNQAMSTCLEFPTLLTTETPHHQRTEMWCLRTGTPYHPFDAAAKLTHKSIECPQCTCSLSVAFLDTDGMGYSQENFKTTCLCGFLITMENLGMYKFAKNILEQNPPASYLAGSLHTPHNANDTLRAEKMKQTIVRARPLARLTSRARIGRTATTLVQTRPVSTANDFMRASGHSPAMVRSDLLYSTRLNSIKRVLGAYMDDRLFSVDLVGAVLRQASFVQKMHDLGWTNPGSFDSEEDAIVLRHCITRYHAFLGLMAESQGSFFVPTIDIDLAWHTHQLLARQYQEDCLELVGRHVNHDDKVEENKLATSFDVTCRAWQDRYGVPYMYCGCPPPGEKVGQRLRRLLSNGNLKGDRADPSLVPTDDATARAATHPSDHNAVFLMHKQTQAMCARERRKKKAEERRIRVEKAASRDVLSVAGAPKQTQNRRSLRDFDHTPAFMVPVPFPIYYAGAGCVGACGGVVNGAAICGSGGCTAGVGGCSSAGGGCHACGGGCVGGRCGGGRGCEGG